MSTGLSGTVTGQCHRLIHGLSLRNLKAFTDDENPLAANRNYSLLGLFPPNAHGIRHSLAKSLVNRHIAGALLSLPNTRLAYE